MKRPSITVALTMVCTAWAAGQSGGFDHSHALLAPVLQTYVRQGLVDYAGLKRRPAELDRYLDALAKVSEGQFNQWSASQQMAFLINLYNASTLRLVREHYPVKSIKQIGSWFKGPFRQEAVRLFGGATTLDYVEHGLLRVKYQEPRIHFALVCAARGCPELRAEPYRPTELEQQLEDQGKKFMATPVKNRADLRERILHLSPIFKWFSEDFERAAGSVEQYAARFLPPEIQAAVRQGGFRVRYLNYDWTLNDAKASAAP